ncbi:MAG TPA: phage holin family protein [Mucilaginibacter sp.]|jgi:hypothetical protein|nr:phage holin family protein [Mucilaginibacter sp.]
MEEQKPTPPPIIDQLKEYAETQIKLAKYDAIEKGSRFMAGLITDLVIAVIFVLTFLFLSFSLAFVLSNLLHSYWAGFGTMGGIYLIIAIIIILTKEKIKKPLIDAFIKKFFQ